MSKIVNKGKNPYTIGNADNLEKALEGLGQFCHNWCMNCKEIEKQDDLVFRCKGCVFEQENGQCQIKVFLSKHTNGKFGRYTCMGEH